MNRTIEDWRAMSPSERTKALRESRAAAQASAKSHHVFISVADVESVTETRGVDGSLASIPIAVKDNIEVAGFTTTGGTRYLTAEADADADVVAALTSDGAVVVGKTNMHELAFGITSNNGAYGAVRNPSDPSRTAGGSSGGSAAAVALGVVPLSVGTDTGASVSVPAAFCGVAGLRPSTGRYPGDGIIHLSWTRDTAGLHANSVADLRWADERITGEVTARQPTAPNDLVIGVPATYYEDLDEVVGRDADVVLAELRAHKIRLVPMKLPRHFETTAESEMVVVGWEAPRTIMSYLAGLGDPQLPADLGAVVELTASPDVAAILNGLHAAPVPASDYRRARTARWRLRREFIAALDHDNVAAILFPTVPVVPPLLGEGETLELNGQTRSVFGTVTRQTAPGTFMGMPMVTLPVAAPDSLPVGFTLMGRPFDDIEVLRVADLLSRIVGRKSRGQSPRGGKVNVAR